MDYQFFGFLFLSVLAFSQKVDAQNTCHLREVDICAANLAVFVQGAGRGPDTETIIDRQCASITDAAQCISNYTDLCLTDTQKQLSDILFDGASKIQKEYCEKNSQLRAMYMKHAPCLQQVTKEQKTCLKLLQAGLESLTKAHWNKRIPYLCCTYHRLRGCFENLVKEKCGDGPLDLLHQLLRALLSRLPDLMCTEHNDQSEMCIEVPRTVPEGTARGDCRATAITSWFLLEYRVKVHAVFHSCLPSPAPLPSWTMYTYKPLAPIKSEKDDQSSIWSRVIQPPQTITAAAAITGLDLHPLTSEILVTCTNKVELFDTSLESKRSLYSVSTSPKYSGCFRPKDGQLIAVGQGSGVISIYRSGKGNLLRELRGHKKATKCVIFADEFHVLSCSDDGTAKEWDLGSASVLNEWDHKSNAITCVTSVQEVNYFATGTTEGVIRLWDRRVATPMHTLDVGSEAIASLTSRKSLIFASIDRSIFAYDLITGRQLISLPNIHGDVISSMTILNDHLISCSADGMVKIFDKDTLNEVHQMKHPHTNIQHSATDGKTLVTGSTDGSVFVHPVRFNLLAEPKELKVNKKIRLRNFDRHLKQGDHSSALTAALLDEPCYTVALLQELIRRRKLSSALIGSDTTPLVDFVVENLSDADYTRTLVDVTEVLIEYLSRQVFTDENARSSIERLNTAIKDEAKLIIQMKKLSGQLELLQKAHH